MGADSTSAEILRLPLPPREPSAPTQRRAQPCARAKESLPIPSWPSAERPRERLLRLGPDALSDAELLAILLRTGEGAGKGSALDQARSLLAVFGGPAGLARALGPELCTHPGIGPAKACSVLAAFVLAERARSASGEERAAIGCSEDVYRLMGARLARKRAEEFWVLLLDVKNRLIREQHVSLGALVGAQVHPREAFSAAVREGAAAVVFVHNHPSGDPTPSQQDRDLTRRLVDGAKLLGIRVLDHVVIGKERWESFADRGWL